MKSIAILICVGLIIPTAFIQYNDTFDIDDQDIANELEPMEKFEYTIRIDGDHDLSSFPGEGTYQSPYIIEGKDINADGRGTAIYIGNTTAHFILNNNKLIRASENPSYYHWNSCLVLYNVTNGKVHNNTIQRGRYGMYLKNVYNVTVDDNSIIQSSSSSIYLESSQKVGVFNNYILSSSGDGVRLLQSADIDVRFNEVLNSRRAGISVESSHKNLILGNLLSGNSMNGILLDKSMNNEIYGNEFEGTGVGIGGDLENHWFSHDIPSNNTLDDLPIYYLTNQTGGTIHDDIGQIILVNVTELEIHDIELIHGSVGLAIAFSDSISVNNVSVSSHVQPAVHLFHSHNNSFYHLEIVDNREGMLFENSNNNQLNSVKVIDNSMGGIEAIDSFFLHAYDSEIENNGQIGIRLIRSPSAFLSNSTLRSHNRGISIERSDDVWISDGRFIDNTEGIFLSFSTGNIIENNTFDGPGLRLAGNLKEQWNSHEVNNNTINGNPLVYMANSIGGNLDTDAEQIILANTSDLTVMDQKLSGGISLGFSHDISMQNVTSHNHSRDALHIYRSHNNTFHTLNTSSNLRGVYEFLSNDNVFINLTAEDNFYGIYMHTSDNSSISESTFKNNSVGVYLSSSNRIDLLYNSFEDNGDSTVIIRTENTTLSNNVMEGGGIFMDGQKISQWNSHEIGNDNVLNGSPILYIKDQTGGDILGPASQILIANSSDIAVEHLELLGGSTGISIAFSSYIHVNNVTVENHSRYGSYLYSTHNSSMNESKFRGNSHGAIYMSYSSDNYISHNEFLDTRYGIYFLESLQNSLTHNLISNGTYGVYMRGSHSNLLLNNTINLHRNGIDISSSDSNILNENTVHENSRNGIRLYNSDFNTIENNTAEDNLESGLSIRGGFNNTVHNCILFNNSQNGIYLLNAENNFVKSVIMSHNGYSGALIRYSHNNNFIENSIDSNRWYGIFASGSFENKFNYNSIKHNHYGIYLLSSDENELEGNTVNEGGSTPGDVQAVMVGVEAAVLDDYQALEELCEAVDGRISGKFEYIDVVLILLDGEISVSRAVEILEKKPTVRFAEPDGEVELLEIPNDPYYDQLWGLNKTNLPAAWNSTTGTGDAVVAVVDTGIDYEHEDLAGNMWSDEEGNHGYNALEDNYDPMDDHGHGTHASGTVGAVGNNSIGITGVNWNVSLMALKFISSGGTGNISGAVACLEYVLQRKQAGDNIIATSNSWGSGSFSRSLYEAVQAHQDHGILFVAAAGNSGENSDEEPLFPAAFNLTNVISVAASDQDDNLASFSNYGSNSVHLAAPGVYIYSTELNHGYSHRSGTSMATPHVSGLAALIWAKNESMDMVELKNSILSHVEKTPSFEGYLVTSGRMDANRSVHPDTGGFHVRTQISEGYTGSVGKDKDIFVAVTNGVHPILNAPVNVSFDSGEPPLILRDNGKGADQVSGDGYYSGTWTPTLSGNITLNITVDAGDNRTFYREATVFIRGHTGMALERSFNNHIENNLITNTQDGISLKGSSGNLVTNQTIYDLTNHGISLEDSDSNRILENTIEENIGKGIHAASSSSNEIIRNEIVLSQITGIEIQDNSGWNTVEENTIHNSSYGLYLHTNAHNNSVYHNYVYNGSRNIYLMDSYFNHLYENTAVEGDYGLYLTRSHDNVIEYNNASRNILSSSSTGIYITSSNNNTIRGNDVLNNSYRAVYLGNSDYNLIDDNQCSYSDQHGIYLYSSDFNTINNNTARGNYRGILLYRSSYNSLYRNLLENNTGSGVGYGVFLSSESIYNHLLLNTASHNDNGLGISGNYNLIDSNDVTSNNRYGIYVYSRFNEIVNNTIYYNENGIYLWFGSSDNVILENRFFHNVYGLEARRSSDRNLVDTNEFFNNTVSIFLSSENTSVVNNLITGSSVGIDVVDPYNHIYNNTITDSSLAGIRLSEVINTKIILNQLIDNNVSVSISEGSSENKVIGNNLSQNEIGVFLNYSGSLNVIYGNNLTDNQVGIHVLDSLDNRFHHNNIINNFNQVVIQGDSWASWDDGMGEGNYWSDYQGEDLTGNGIGDTLIPHPEEDMGDGYHALDDYPIVEPVQILSYELDLKALVESDGWQLASIPIVPYDSSIEELFAYLDYSRAYIFSDENWYSYVPGRRPDFNNFEYLAQSDAFFIKMENTSTLSVIGHAPVSGTTSITLQPGWNLVGHPSLEEKNAVDLLPLEVTRIGLFNKSREYNIEYVEDYSELVLEPGKGYWVYNSANENVTFEVEW